MSESEIKKPPPTLATERVLEYAIIKDPVKYSGNCLVFSGGIEVGPVPCLALCETSTKRKTVRLIYCDSEWNFLAGCGFQSLQEAKEYAEHAYPGVSSLWIRANVSPEEAERHIEEIWGPMRCNFCGRRPFDFDEPRFIQKGSAWICEDCIRACYQMLQEDSGD